MIYSYAFRGCAQESQLVAVLAYNKNINLVTEMEKRLISRRESSRHGIPYMVIQIKCWYLGKYIFIIDNKWSNPRNGDNIEHGQYFC